MGKPTYDELRQLYKECEREREDLIFENEELKDRIYKSLKMIELLNFGGKFRKLTTFDLERIENILKGKEEKENEF